MIFLNQILNKNQKSRFSLTDNFRTKNIQDTKFSLLECILAKRKQINKNNNLILSQKTLKSFKMNHDATLKHLLGSPLKVRA